MAELRLEEVIRRPLITEKNTWLMEKGQYTFEVHPEANKLQIRQAVQETFSVQVKAVNTLIEQKGGICAVDGQNTAVLPLPVAGIMSTDDAHTVAQAYAHVDKMAKALGSSLKAPFMTLSFMALLVIPSLKLSDKGLFDGDKFTFTDVLT